MLAIQDATLETLILNLKNRNDLALTHAINKKQWLALFKSNIDGPFGFSIMAKDARASDRVRFYYTGRGSPTETKNYSENVLNLWNQSDMKVQEFATKLQKLSSSTHTQVLMVQCFSGGFAQLIFDQGKKGAAFTESNQC